MASNIFVNLPVADLDRSIVFFKSLGFAFDVQFTNHEAARMVISDDIYAMLLTRDKFKQFTRKQIADATRTTEVLTALFVDSKAEVDRVVGKALQAGATEAREPMDFGFMSGRSFNDPDGHIWEIFWIDSDAAHECHGADTGTETEATA